MPDTVIAEIEAMVADAFGLDGRGGASGAGCRVIVTPEKLFWIKVHEWALYKGR
jgi:hypothetical protein